MGTEKFLISERKIVQTLHTLLFDPKNGRNRYRIDGAPIEEFLNEFKKPILLRATTDSSITWKEVENYRKLEFYLESCIEKGYIRKEDGNLKLTAKGWDLISWTHWAHVAKEISPIVIALLSLVVAVIAAYYTGEQASLLRFEIEKSGSV